MDSKPVSIAKTLLQISARIAAMMAVSVIALFALAGGLWAFAHFARFALPEDPFGVARIATIVFALGWGFTILYTHSLALGLLAGHDLSEVGIDG